jgi:hypothetical protein
LHLSRFSPLLLQPSTGRPMLSRQVSTPKRVMIMGCATGASKPPASTAPRSTTKKLTPGPSSVINGVVSAGVWVRGCVLGALFRPQRTKPRLSCVLRRFKEKEPGVSGARSYRAHYGAHGAPAGSCHFHFVGIFGAAPPAYRPG